MLNVHYSSEWVSISYEMPCTCTVGIRMQLAHLDEPMPVAKLLAVLSKEIFSYKCPNEPDTHKKPNLTVVQGGKPS